MLFMQAPVAPANPAINGPEIRRLRQQAGLSVTALADQAEVTPSYISALERGRRARCSPATLNRICDALAVDHAALLMPVPARSAA